MKNSMAEMEKAEEEVGVRFQILYNSGPYTFFVKVTHLPRGLSDII